MTGLGIAARRGSTGVERIMERTFAVRRGRASCRLCGVDAGRDFGHDPAELGHLLSGQDGPDVLIDTA